MSDRRPVPSLAVPILLGLATFALWQGFQTVELLLQRNALAAAYSQQDRAVMEGDRLRRQMQAVFAGAADLAKKGNTHAAQVLDALARQGVTYTPNQPAGG